MFKSILRLFVQAIKILLKEPLLIQLVILFFIELLFFWFVVVVLVNCNHEVMFEFLRMLRMPLSLIMQ
jgi:hypothetical protein